MKLFLSLQSDSVVVVEIHEGSAVERSAVSLVDLRLSNVQPVPVPMELLEPPKEPPATEKREEIRERLRENALFRRAEILDHSGISVEEASVVALLDAAADEIMQLRTAIAPDAGTMGDALSQIAAERRRQRLEEGWTAEHDDEHFDGEMADAAACYASTDPARVVRWPWASTWWKPSPDDRRRELVKAGALIVAEIERLERASRIIATPGGESTR